MKRPAFTLIELLVVTAVFSVLFLIGTGVYTNAFGKQKVVQAKQRVATEARSALETIARSVRVGNIDYAYYKTGCGGATPTPCDLTLPQSIIAVRDSSNVQNCFGVSGGQLWVTTTSCNQPIASPNWTIITPDDLTISDFAGWIIPAGDPFLGPPTKAADCKNQSKYDGVAGVCSCTASTVAADCWIGQSCDPTANICKNPNQQPMITVGFTLQTKPGAAFVSSTHLQTSVVTRTYQR